MARHFIKRLLSSIVAFFIFTAVIFFGINLLIPSDYVVTQSLALQGNEARDALREELGLNLPLTEQYVIWLGSLLRGDLGREFGFGGSGEEVSDLIASALPATLLIFFTGAILAFLIGHYLGQKTAWRSPRWLSGTVIIGSIAAYTAFPPWLAFLLGFIIIDQFELLPDRYAHGNLEGVLWRGVDYTPEQIVSKMLVGMIVITLLLMLLNLLSRRFLKRGIPFLLIALLFVGGNLLLWRFGGYQELALDIVKLGAIPLLAFTLLSFGDTMLITRSGMQDVKHEPYILTARAKGVPENDVRRKHAGRNAILPVLSQFVISIPYLLTAVVIIERATGWAGIGDLLFDAIDSQNTFVYMGILVVVALISLVARLLLEITYAYLDPRIRYGTGVEVKTS